MGSVPYEAFSKVGVKLKGSAVAVKKRVRDSFFNVVMVNPYTA
jgi:hypothetical protein